MGNYAEFSLDVERGNYNQKDIISYIINERNTNVRFFNPFASQLEEILSDNEYSEFYIESDGEYEWSEYTNDMKKLSLEFPNVVFILYSENNSNFWKKYFFNGKMQTSVAKVVFDAFDENLLI